MPDQETIAGRYDLERIIGVGGVARVYLARDRMLGRQVATKIVYASAGGDPSSIERFKREARAAAALNHPNIVAIYDWGRQDESYYMVMEYVPGPNLKEVIRSEGALGEIRSLEIAAQVAGALSTAHEHGLIHRDVKPHNILLDPHGWVKVTDFGIAQNAELEGLTQTNAIAGTPQYLSPEQAQGRPLDSRSDLYSLGVVLYEMVTGREPFSGGTLIDIALRHVQEAPVPPRNLNPDISPATERIILTAMAKDPRRRYADAAGMRAAIVAELSRLRAAGTPVPDPSRVTSAGQPTTRIPVTRPRAATAPPTGHARGWLLGVPAVLGALVLGAVFVYSVVSGAFNGSQQGRHGLAARVVPTGTHSHRTATLRPSPVPTRARLTATASATAIPPTLAPTSKPSPAPVAAATSVPGPAGTGTSDPAATVQAFYRSVSNHDFARAAALWSDNMRAQNPPGDNIDARFSDTTAMQVLSARTVSSDAGAGTATVAIDVREYRQHPPKSREFVGAWNLVRGDHGWLLDSTSLKQVQANNPGNSGNAGD